MTRICRHGIDNSLAVHCRICLAHLSGFDTGARRDEPHATQLDSLAQSSEEIQRAWWCGWAEAKEPIHTDSLGNRVALHQHVAGI